MPWMDFRRVAIMNTSQHIIHYQPRRIHAAHADSWFAEPREPDDGFKRPGYHTTRQTRGAASWVREGDVIWMVGQLHAPWGTLPPSLDARINVEKVERLPDGRFRFAASADSCWFPLFDARPLLRILQTQNAKGQVMPLWRRPTAPIGQYLQSPRMLVSGEEIQSYAKRMLDLPLQFISYRIADGTQPAFELARALVDAGHAVFWDRWSLPRRLAERREVVSDTALDEHLLSCLRSVQTVWGVESPLYAAPGSYSVKEQSEAMNLGIWRTAGALPRA